MFTFLFYRNGNSMGKAFSNINRGPGYVYFPAVSLAASENLRANFGATPLRYPYYSLHYVFPQSRLRPKKKICVFTVTRPTLIFASDPMHFYTEFG